MQIPINKVRRALHRLSVSIGALGSHGGSSIDAGVFGSLVRLSERNRFIRVGTLVRLIFLTLAAAVTLTGHITQADQWGTNSPRVIEVFTVADQPGSTSTMDRLTGRAVNIELQVYRIDGIQKIEAVLSRHLPSDPSVAKRVALDRIQQLDNQASARMQRAVIGLTKALQYGIDRYPAMVFDGQLVVYGVTELDQALHQYHQWQGGA